MKNRMNLLLLATFLAVSLFTGCASTPPVDEEVLAMSVTERESDARKMADAYMNAFMKSFRDNDFELFRSILSPQKQKSFTPEMFRTMRESSLKEQGKLKSAEYALSLDKAIFRTFVWKLSYEKEGVDQETILRDFLFFVRIGKTDENTFSVAGAGFCL